MLKLSKKKKKKKKKKGSVDSPKGDISRVHPLKSAKGDEELRPVCVKAIVGHGKHPALAVLDTERFILKGRPVN